MSFQYLENPRGGKHASKQQPKQRRDEESTFERSIKANIQQMQENVRKAAAQLDSAQRSHISRRMGESLDKALERSRELSQETERLFRDWTVHLAGEPTERHRKKFSFEKLQRTFEDEVVHLKDVARRAVAAQQEALNAERSSQMAIECNAMCEEQCPSPCGEEQMEQGLLDGEVCQARQAALQEDAQIRNRIAQEREEGIRRIQNQVSEVNQIFRDLATIVQEQGQQFDTIEDQAASASSSAKQTVGELKKAVNRQKGSCERLCWMLAGVIIVLCIIVLPHMHGVLSNLQFGHGVPLAATQAGGGLGFGRGEELPTGFSSAHAIVTSAVGGGGSVSVIRHSSAELPGGEAAIPTRSQPGGGSADHVEPVVISKVEHSDA
jgi:hypothetical protein